MRHAHPRSFDWKERAWCERTEYNQRATERDEHARRERVMAPQRHPREHDERSTDR
jgi:hypothetical protein